MTWCRNDSASLSNLGVLTIVCATMADVCTEIFAKKGYVVEQKVKFNDLNFNNELRHRSINGKTIRCAGFLHPNNEDVKIKLKHNVLSENDNGKGQGGDISSNNNVVKEVNKSGKAVIPRHPISKKNNQPGRLRIYSDKEFCKLSKSSNDINAADVDEPKKANPRKKLISKKGKKPARRKTDPYNDFHEGSKGLKQTIHRSISDPGPGNLPIFGLLGVELNIFSVTDSLSTDDSNVEFDTQIHNSTYNSTSEACVKNGIVQDFQVIACDGELLNANKAILHKCSQLASNENEQSNVLKKDTPGDQSKDKEVIVSSSSETGDLVTEIVYTHDDVDFLNSIEHGDLFEEPTEILYATRVDINALKNVDISDQINCTISDLANECSTKTIENDDELCEVVEELRKGNDFRNTITDTQTPSCSTSPDSPSSESHDNDQYLSINIAEDTDEGIAEVSDDEVKVNLETFERDLQQLMEESAKSKTITPIVKMELQCKIQCTRLKMGKEELEVEFSQPKKYQLTEDEIRKVNARREQNRRSAKKGRLKAKQKERHLTQILNKASSSIAKLTREVVELRSMKTDLLQKLKSHFQDCQLFTLIEQQKKFLASSGF